MYNYDLIKECVWTHLRRVATPCGSHPTNFPPLRALNSAGGLKKKKKNKYRIFYDAERVEQMSGFRTYILVGEFTVKISHLPQTVSLLLPSNKLPPKGSHDPIC